MKLISSIERKNRCLERFLKITEEKCSELSTQLETIDEKAIDLFVCHREALLKLVQYQDSRIIEGAKDISESERTPELLTSVQKLMSETDDLVAKIQKADELFFAKMKELGESLQVEIARARKTSGTLSRFKGTNETSGTRLDKTL